MTTTQSKTLEEADARLAAAEKRLKQAKANRALILQRANKAKDDRRTRTNVLTGVAIQHALKNAKTAEERRKLWAYIHKLIDAAFKGRKESDYKAVTTGLNELAADYPPLDEDSNERGEGSATSTATSSPTAVPSETVSDPR